VRFQPINHRFTGLCESKLHSRMHRGPTGVVANNCGAGTPSPARRLPAHFGPDQEENTRRSNPTGGQLRVGAAELRTSAAVRVPTEIDPLYLFGRCVAWELRKPSPIRRGNFSPLHKVPEDDCRFGRPLASFPKENHRPKSSRRRRVCARLTGISVCFLSSMRS
jgi:hypothetical protein